MTLEEMGELFEKHGEIEQSWFDRVTEKSSKRHDLHAFILLDKLVPGHSQPIIGAAAHDEIFLHVDANRLASVITEDLVIELLRCGVFFDPECDSLAMFV